MERHPRILVVDDEPDIRRMVGELLRQEGFRTVRAPDGESALRLAGVGSPDLILLDLGMPGISGTEVLKVLRDDYRTRHIPVILLTGRDSVADKVLHLDAGADDYVTKPFDADELLARVRATLERSALLRGMSPLTHLPGNAEIADEIDRRLASGRPFACLYADLDRFKSYNDHYGFARGDAVIRALVAVVLAALRDVASDKHFVGHIGGDDLLILTEPALAERLAREIADRFDAVAPGLYDAADRARGSIESRDRHGELVQEGFVSVSIGVALSTQRKFRSHVDLARAAAQAKELAKGRPRSAWAFDRRRA